jgi:alpha-galactosidase
MTEHIVCIGAGSLLFLRGLVADLIRYRRPCELALVDIEAESLAIAERLVTRMASARQAEITVRASLDRRECLREATTVICTIGLGGREAWERDVFIPRTFGIYQPVGDTVLPGGASRALRMIPPMVAIAEDVLELAPDALFLNVANPMAPVCGAVRRATGAHIVGLCQGVYHLAHYLASLLAIPPSTLTYAAVGINHLTWLTNFRRETLDLWPRLMDLCAHMRAQEPTADTVGGHFLERPIEPSEALLEDLNPFSWWLLDNFGALPALLDRHAAEFFPALFARKGSYYGQTLGVDVYSFENTLAFNDLAYAELRDAALDEEPLYADYFTPISGNHEGIVELLLARHDGQRTFSVNIPNSGQVPNLPAGAIIECPAVMQDGQIEPIPQPPLAPALVGTLLPHIAWADVVVEAALRGNRDQFIQALVLDGSVSSLEVAIQLADALLQAQQEHLPQFASTLMSSAGVEVS